MPESQRKKRRRARQSPEEVLAQRVTEFVSERPGVTLETHTAGYFNELGFRLDVPEEFTSEDILELGNSLLEVLLDASSKLELSWDWLVGIYREDDLIRVLDSDDEPHRICPVCAFEQKESWDVCLQCETPAPTVAS